MERAILATALAAVFLGGCQTAGSGRTPAAEAGAIAPATPISSTGPGATVEGGFLSQDIRGDLTAAEKQAAANAEYRALEYGRAGQPVSWRGTGPGNYGEIVVGRGYEVNRLDCREYTHTIYVGGRAQVSKGTACRDPSGSWRAVN